MLPFHRGSEGEVRALPVPSPPCPLFLMDLGRKIIKRGGEIVLLRMERGFFYRYTAAFITRARSGVVLSAKPFRSAFILVALRGALREGYALREGRWTMYYLQLSFAKLRRVR